MHMNLFKKPVKMIILFLVIFIFGTAIASAILIRPQVQEAEANLRQATQTLVTIEWKDQEALGAHRQYLTTVHGFVFWCPDPYHPFYVEGEDCEVTDTWVEYLTPEIIHQISQVEHIYFYDYLIHSEMYSLDLRLATRRYGSDRYRPNRAFDSERLMPFPLMGTTRTELIQVEKEEIEIIYGRQFELHEQIPSEGEPIAAIVSREFARANDLELHSIFTLSNWIIIPTDWWNDVLPWEVDDLENNKIYAHIETNFEIIGIFNLPNLEVDEDAVTSLSEYWHRDSLLETIFVPNWFLEEAHHRRDQLIFSMLESLDSEARSSITRQIESGLDERFFMDVSPIFVLDDRLSIDDFESDVAPYLPRFQRFADLSIPYNEVVYSDMRSSVTSLQNISNWILYVSTGMTLLILSLLVTMFLHRNRGEMIGDLVKKKKKSKIISQLLMEILVVSVVALTVSFFVGNMISDTISSNMLTNENELMIEEEPEPWWAPVTEMRIINKRTLQALGISGNEIIEQSQTIEIVLFTTVGLGTVVLSTIVPMLYVGKLTKENGDIG